MLSSSQGPSPARSSMMCHAWRHPRSERRQLGAHRAPARMASPRSRTDAWDRQTLAHGCSAKLQGALEPVDRPKEVTLAERHAAMPQNVVRCRYKEEEIRQGELLQVVVGLQFPVIAAGGPGDDLALRAVHLRVRQGLHEA